MNESESAPVLPQNGQQYSREDGQRHDQVGTRETNMTEESQRDEEEKAKGRKQTLRVRKNSETMTGGQAEGRREGGR